MDIAIAKTLNIKEEKKDANEFGQMLSELDEPLRKTTKDMIKGMLMAQETYRKQEQEKESA